MALTFEKHLLQLWAFLISILQWTLKRTGCAVFSIKQLDSIWLLSAHWWCISLCSDFYLQVGAELTLMTSLSNFGRFCSSAQMKLFVLRGCGSVLEEVFQPEPISSPEKLTFSTAKLCICQVSTCPAHTRHTDPTDVEHKAPCWQLKKHYVQKKLRRNFSSKKETWLFVASCGLHKWCQVMTDTTLNMRKQNNYFPVLMSPVTVAWENK